MKDRVTDGYMLWWLIDKKFVGSLVHLTKGAERDRLTGARRIHIDIVESSRRALQLGQHLHHHVIAVELGEILRHLPLPERVVERIVDQLRLDAEAGLPGRGRWSR